MRRADTILALVVVGFGVFVGSAVVRGRGTRERVERARAEATKASPEHTTDPSPSPRSGRRGDVTSLGSSDIARAPDSEHLRERIASAGDSYMADMLEDDGMLVRWPDRREQGLRIWVQSLSYVPNWDLRYAQMARDAFAEWGGDGLPARLDFVLDSANSDIQIVWLDRFPPDAGLRVGTTKRVNDQKGWIVAAQISVAVHDSAARIIEPADLAGIVRHEAGHALGLGHSKDPKTKMFPVEKTNAIMPADRATLRLLYQLTPGSVR